MANNLLVVIHKNPGGLERSHLSIALDFTPFKSLIKQHLEDAAGGGEENM